MAAAEPDESGGTSAHAHTGLARAVITCGPTSPSLFPAMRDQLQLAALARSRGGKMRTGSLIVAVMFVRISPSLDFSKCDLSFTAGVFGSGGRLSHVNQRAREIPSLLAVGRR